MAFSPDGHTLASRQPDGTVRLWDVSRSGAPPPARPAPDRQHAAVTSVAFSPDGRTLASGSADGTIRLWDVTDPARPRPLGQAPTGSGSAVYSVAFSPDGHTLASGGADGTIRLWDVADPRPPAARPAPDRQQRRRELGGVQPRRTHAGQRRDDGTIRLWNLPLTILTAAARRGHGSVQPSTDTCWPAAARTARSGCGTSPIPRAPTRSAHPRPAA